MGREGKKGKEEPTSETRRHSGVKLRINPCAFAASWTIFGFMVGGYFGHYVFGKMAGDDVVCYRPFSSRHHAVVTCLMLTEAPVCRKVFH